MKLNKTNRRIGEWLGCVTIAGMAFGSLATAQDTLQTLAPITVIGSEEELFKLMGSAAFVGSEEISKSGHTDIGKILAKVPGVYVRDEDGYGNFPNISLRGADGTRSEKLTIMEDGILTAPSPYSAPAAYYSPKPARMSGIEVLKGSSQVRYGPQSTGGVINYLSTEIPDEQKFYSRTTYGTDNTFFNHTWFGDTKDTEAGKIGYLLEMHGQTSDGFRKIDGSNQDTGFDLIEPMLKMFWEPNTALKQRIEFKVGYTDLDSNESYTGLTEADLAADPDRRYSATQFDEFASEQWRTYAKWIAEPSDALRLESAVYYNQFGREWDKLDQVNGRALHEALLNAGDVATLNGTAAGTTRTTNNMRDHEGYGWQNQANFKFETGEITHDLAAGVRFHYDRQDAKRQRTAYAADGFGNFVATPGPVTFNGINETFATALYVEDEVKVGKLTLRPGARYEWLEMDFTDSTGAQFSGNENLFTAGIGASYELSDRSTLFSGIYQGVASPSPQSYLVTGTENEESLGYELGYRYRRENFNAEVVGFLTDFSQLISTDAGFGFTNTSQNAGEAQVYGLESIVKYDPGLEHNLGFGLPMYVSATYTSAQFTGGNLVAGGGDGVYAGGVDGNEIPYVPEWKLAAGVGVSGEKWEVRLDANYMGSTWGTGYNDDVRPGTPTIRDGKIPALLLFDLTADYAINENVKLLAGVLNVFDKREMVSRIPEGPRANAPRMLFGGVEVTF